MGHLTKVLLRIIMARMRKSLRPEISQLQFGFVPDKSTRNAIFTLSMLAERCIEMQKDLYLCFIDFSKAFDKVRHEKLFNILEHLDIDGKDLRVIRNLYWDQSAAVRIGGELSEYKLIKRGVRGLRKSVTCRKFWVWTFLHIWAQESFLNILLFEFLKYLNLALSYGHLCVRNTRNVEMEKIAFKVCGSNFAFILHSKL